MLGKRNLNKLTKGRGSTMPVGGCPFFPALYKLLWFSQNPSVPFAYLYFQVKV